MAKKVKLIQLFGVFFKIGIMTFGGGLAMLPILDKEVNEKRQWTTNKELLDYYAISQCTPGIIAVNTATFIGYSKRGILGGIIATLGVICPSLLIITLLGTIIKQFQDNIYLIKAFAGIRIAVCALILKAIIKLVKANKINALFLILIFSCLILKFLLNISSSLIIIFTITFGFLFHFIRMKKNKGSSL